MTWSKRIVVFLLLNSIGETSYFCYFTGVTFPNSSACSLSLFLHQIACSNFWSKPLVGCLCPFEFTDPYEPKISSKILLAVFKSFRVSNWQLMTLSEVAKTVSTVRGRIW